jgi:hypothetical protein
MKCARIREFAITDPVRKYSDIGRYLAAARPSISFDFQ